MLAQFAQLALLALLIEAAVGYPDAAFRRIGHPVTWIGKLIAWAEQRWNRPPRSDLARRGMGVVLVAILIAVSIAAGIVLWWLATLLAPPLVGVLLVAMAASTLIAQRSLDRHVAAVATALERDGLEAGRKAVSQIVGRDPDQLDEARVCRAAIESLAENFSDGVVAPLFWLLVGGLPGAVAYKAINTADSMIGHRSERYRHFGWAAARTDDVVNLPASRLSALWLVLAAAIVGADWRSALRAVWRDAGKHRSPNAGWPEAAMAGALRLRLAGPRIYGGQVVEDHWMGDGRAEAQPADIRKALRLYRAACALQIGVIAALALILPLTF